MLILAGLGNPGAKFARNRHNIGQMAVDAIAERWRFTAPRARFSSIASEGAINTAEGPVRALIIKPQTFYNDSGRAIGEAMKFYKLTPADVVVFYDEIDLAPGRFPPPPFVAGGPPSSSSQRLLVQEQPFRCFTQ